MTGWNKWIGRKSTQVDLIDQALVERWNATFDRDRQSGIVQPQGLHFCLCTPEADTSKLGDDGHPKRTEDPQGIYPPIPLPRRMWAASTIEFKKPLCSAQRVERISEVMSISEKGGKSGKLAFLELQHQWIAEGEEAIREKQTLVYRDAAPPEASLSPSAIGQSSFAHGEWDAATSIVPNEALLFRFSALTFNTHRIHYDQPYTRDVERYRGLVVHGPLIATKLMQLVADTYGENALANFSFRAVSPAIAGEPLHLAMRQSEAGLELGAFAHDGRQTMRAYATLN